MSKWNDAIEAAAKVAEQANFGSGAAKKIRALKRTGGEHVPGQRYEELRPPDGTPMGDCPRCKRPLQWGYFHDCGLAIKEEKLAASIPEGTRIMACPKCKAEIVVGQAHTCAQALAEKPLAERVEQLARELGGLRVTCYLAVGAKDNKWPMDLHPRLRKVEEWQKLAEGFDLARLVRDEVKEQLRRLQPEEETPNVAADADLRARLAFERRYALHQAAALLQDRDTCAWTRDELAGELLEDTKRVREYKAPNHKTPKG